MFKCNKYSHRLVVAIIVYLFISIFIFRVSLFENNPKYLSLAGDLEIPSSINNLISYYYPLWSDQFSKSNIPFVSRYPVFLPFLFSAKLFNINPMTILEIFWVLTGAIAGLSTYLTSSFLINREFKHINTNTVFIASLLGGFFYLFNPFFANESRHMLIRFSYALVPLIFLAFVNAMEKKEFKYVLIASLIWVIISANPRGLVFGGISLVLALFYVIFISKAVSTKDLYRLAYWTSLILILYFALSSFWVIPYFMAAKNSNLEPEYVISKEVILTLSQSNLLDVFLSKMPNLFSAKWFFSFSPKLEIINKIENLYPIIQIIIPILAFGVLIVKRTFHTLFFAIVALISMILLAVTENKVIWDSYLWFVLYSPLSSSFGWIIRKTYDFYPFFMFSLSVLLSFSLTIFTEHFSKHLSHIVSKILTLCLILLTIISIILVSWPLLTGDFNGELKPVKLPEEYFIVNQWLYEHGNNTKAVWFPKYNVEDTTWREGRLIQWIDDLSSSIPTYFISMSGSERVESDLFFEFISSIHYRWKDDILLSNKTNNLGQILSPLNIEYLVFHDDIPNNQNTTALNTLYNQKDMKLYFKEGFIQVFKNEAPIANTFYVPNFSIASEGGLEKLPAFSQIDEVNLKEIALFYKELKADQEILGNSDAFLSEGDTEDPIQIEGNQIEGNGSILLEPFNSVKSYKPAEVWSRFRTTDPDGGNWRIHLIERGIDNWEFDYSKGIVFTWSNSPNNNLLLEFDTDRKDDYEFFIRYLQNKKGGEVDVKLDNEILHQLKTDDDIDRFVWKKIGTVGLEKGKHSLILTNINGFNAVNLIFLIPKDKEKTQKDYFNDTIKEKKIIYLFEAETDMHQENAVISDQFGSDSSNGKVVELSENSRLFREFEIKKQGKYRFAIRMKGKVSIELNNMRYNAESSDFDYIYSEPIYLEKGIMKMSINPRYKTYIDLIWLYSIEGDEKTLKDIFGKNSPAKIISYKKINPTQYEIKLNSTRPFVLAFGEAYDPKWIAYSTSNEYNPLPLYSVINGFYITDVGEINLTVEYKPQRYFDYGSVISVLTFIACIIYLIYNIRRKKNGKES